MAAWMLLGQSRIIATELSHCPQNRKYLLSGPLWKKFADPCHSYENVTEPLLIRVPGMAILVLPKEQGSSSHGLQPVSRTSLVFKPRGLQAQTRQLLPEPKSRPSRCWVRSGSLGILWPVILSSSHPGTPTGPLFVSPICMLKLKALISLPSLNSLRKARSLQQRQIRFTKLISPNTGHQVPLVIDLFPLEEGEPHACLRSKSSS